MVTMEPETTTRDEEWFPLSFDRPFTWASAWAGVRPSQAGVAVSDRGVRATFGPWSVVTPLANVAGAEVTGPFTWFKVIGPPHLSLKDRGLTFAGNADAGVCIR